ncbi:2-C-methyl-D-erythritol 4-phosphate cytidylyltransferase [Pseudohalioglobus sediminis]|uniref:2-C-methyl-D-erythritol 4-phosphate cytidylyltransferase n=1 Tax=Pseudohalioglobus sediminis TaxID=2606449 RepID=A0A5B0X492_9GAMM|nr:2-C-methyl-D-erythritol 4-phosphate cytidylyltransferase [Pseudohalioglobus sediminis]KAA1193448.1 2-C-methyl-D-erythritol 4-phosphate cytidylyltransferase [Pseudohalioglobus sediminis]
MSRVLHGVIPAAGIGTRMGSEIPKQYLRLLGRTLLEHSLHAMLRVPGMQSVTLALHPEDTTAAGLDILGDARVNTVAGGAERVDSVQAALRAVPGTRDDWVLVHDAARPCLQQDDVMRLVDVVLTQGEGAILALPVVDTVKLADAQGKALRTLDRNRLWRAQTPQMFRLGELLDALESAQAAGATVTDEASAMEHAGYPVHLVPGAASNLKVTVPEDLQLAEWYLSRQGEH